MTRNPTRLEGEAFARWWAQTGEYELRQSLHWKWDPIGISGDFPYAADEYDRYAPQVVAVLNTGASCDEVAEMLDIIERERMGLGGSPPDQRLALSSEILAWFASSQDRWVELGPLRR